MTGDTQIVNYLAQHEEREMMAAWGDCQPPPSPENGHLQLALDGTTCWGSTFRDAVVNAMAHDYPPNAKLNRGLGTNDV